MADESWRGLETWERVKWARSQRYESATAAAAALGMQPGTYRCYERGPESAKFIELGFKQARIFAREFKVRWEWLLDGAGEPWLSPPPPPPEATDMAAPPNNLRRWREHRGLTIAQLAKRSGVSPETIEQLEFGELKLSDKVGTALAKGLDTTTGHLRNLDPTEIDPEVFDTFNGIPREHRAQALEILKTFRRRTKTR